ncbi:DUF6145 family protein [Parasporobacterium paucivorans]|uniref:Uncharacterized protein n=1 Tax=Parasporobacterium paucivorans DSM 15970 TaxID=1122934 RepID=A0A1M6JS05_9FIRM|nr:DUF6145 family protein [Parasporobacterium paucivorans]SHJ49390.1 hypothetical protein SAMN02745691_02050 [Parasporobacterium paucivorans DSM 15970]
MNRENVVLCASNFYEKKYYFNEDYALLPQIVRDELKIMCVTFTEDIGGILTLEFDKKGSLQFQVNFDEEDLFFDEIGCELKIKQLQQEKQELFESLEEFNRVFFRDAE